MAGSSMGERRLIFRRDTSVPPPNTMDQAMVSAIKRALILQKAPAHVQIMNTHRLSRGTIKAVTHKNAMAAMALKYREIIITTA
jgi:hypothetical protein